MMPLVKQTAQMRIDNIFGVILCYLVFYMPMNVLLYSGYLKNIPLALEEAAHVDGANLLERYFPNHETDACNSSGTYSTWYME